MRKDSVTCAADAANFAHDLFARVPVPLAVVDSDHAIVLANQTFRDYFPHERSVRHIAHHDVNVAGERFDFELMPFRDRLSLFIGREVTEERSLRERLARFENAAMTSPPEVDRPWDVPAQERSLRGRSIMVVDDEIVITALVREYLSRLGARVEIFNSSEEAFERLAGRAHYDAVICDRRMPEVSGEALYQRVEAIDPEQARRFVFVTGNALDDASRRFFAETHTRYILKPFSLDDLYSVVSTAVDDIPLLRSSHA